jgi:ribosomal protein S18 acetylase RimI-like enzyme
MVLVRETKLADWPALRGIRLMALADAPEAYASTYAQEEAYADAEWRARSAGGNAFLAYVPEISASEPVGLAGNYEAEPGIIQLVSVWVRPQARGRGVGVALVVAVTGWAKARDATAVHLWVNENNIPARRLYERCDFVPTGERGPLPSNPHLYEIGMTHPL